MSGYGHDESAPTPHGVSATNFVGECHQFAERSLRYSNSCDTLL